MLRHRLGRAPVVVCLIFGGTLVPFPLAILPIPTDGGGGWRLALNWSGGAPSGVTFFFQCLTLDPASPQGLSMSNGLAGITP